MGEVRKSSRCPWGRKPLFSGYQDWRAVFFPARFSGWHKACGWHPVRRRIMLFRMWNWNKRVLLFTVLVASFVISGVAHAADEVEPSGPTPEEEANASPRPTSTSTSARPPASGQEQAYYMDTDPSAVTMWRSELAPHGTWVEDPVYGLVWIPDESVVGPDFVPYLTAGYWGYTADGDWIWVSEYEWGQVVFHYGRWVRIPNRGWAWIPGRVYAPAWVVWRVGEPGYDYVGWAPMPPTYYWYGGVAVAFWMVPPPYYVYCESRHVFVHHVHRHVLGGRRAREAGRYTNPYRPARPSSPRGRHAARPVPGPSPEEARVPADAVPRTPAKPKPKVTPTQPKSFQRIATRKASAMPGVSRPVYRGRPARALPKPSRAAPLARRPDISRATRKAAPSPSARTLGRSSTPARRKPSRGFSPTDGAASPRATPRPPSRTSPRPTTRPNYRNYRRAPRRIPGARPSTRPAPSRARPAPSRARPAPTSPTRRPSYAPRRPSGRPRISTPRSRPGARTPTISPRKSQKGNGDNNSRKSRGRGKSRGHRR